MKNEETTYSRPRKKSRHLNRYYEIIYKTGVREIVQGLPKDKTQIINFKKLNGDARTLRSKLTNYIGFLDLEYNTGFDSSKSPGLISVGIVILHAKTLEQADTFYSLCRPQINNKLTPYCQEITGITQTQIDQAPPFQEILPQIDALLKKYNIQTLYTYGNCDKPVFRANVKSVSRLESFGYICDLFFDVIPYISGFLFESSQNVALGKLCNILSIPLEGTLHNALTDAKLLSFVFKAIQLDHYPKEHVAAAKKEIRMRQIYYNNRSFHHSDLTLPGYEKEALPAVAESLWENCLETSDEVKAKTAAMCDDLLILSGHPILYRSKLFRFI